MKIIDCEQGTQAWLDARCGIATASRFSDIITPAKCEFASGASGYAAELIAEKLMGGPDPWREPYQSTDMQRGNAGEPAARSFYELERNIDVQQVGFCLHDNGRWGASPDGLVGEGGGLELKCPAPKTQIKWLIDGGVPREHLAQCHGGMIVTGREYWDFLAYCPGLPPLLVRVEPNEFTDKLRNCLRQFDDLFDSMLAKIVAGREESIRKAIATHGDQLTPDLRGLVPPALEPMPF